MEVKLDVNISDDSVLPKQFRPSTRRSPAVHAPQEAADPANAVANVVLAATAADVWAGTGLEAVRVVARTDVVEQPQY